MSSCASFGPTGPAGVADALRKIDCLASDATAVSFGRLFGEHGAFQVALTAILTIYVAVLALNLITGRSALRMSVFTPKMIKLGLVLTFVTSWIAYQSVVWNLAVGAPDEVAGVLIGSKQSATILFAERLDVLFAAIGAAAESAPASPEKAMLFSPANILSLAALILLVGTVGILAICRLALAALLILGPIFIVLALFAQTRGLFEGWLKSVAMFALVPLLTVIIGSGALMAISPMIAGLGSSGDIPLQSAVSILMASIIYLGLMFVIAKVASSLTRGWRIGREECSPPALREVSRATEVKGLDGGRPGAGAYSERVHAIASSLRVNSHPRPEVVTHVRLAQSLAPALAAPAAGQNRTGTNPRLRMQAGFPGIPRGVLR